ncbi:MAG: response regulator [Kiritimatiellae bacterium]|nr:response regulator [Kiritimatiellia bacterium]
MTTEEKLETESPRKKCILIVDDESFVRDAGCAMITMLGYEAHAVESGQEAERLLRAETTSFDLVLIDLNMPSMLGDECFHLLKKINPSLRAAIITGSIVEDSRVRALEPHGLLGMIQKPFTMDALEQKLREFLPTASG